MIFVVDVFMGSPFATIVWGVINGKVQTVYCDILDKVSFIVHLGFLLVCLG